MGGKKWENVMMDGVQRRADKTRKKMKKRERESKVKDAGVLTFECLTLTLLLWRDVKEEKIDPFFFLSLQRNPRK